MHLQLGLDPETATALRTAADRERRNVHSQAYVLLRQSLGLPFPVPNAPQDNEKPAEVVHA